jgi:hypothetical protein
MKKMIAAIAALVCGSAMAAGQFDGVYQSTTDPEQFYSIHQNGNTLLLTNYGAMPTDGAIYFRYGTDQFRPPKIYTWDVQTGELEGSRAIMTGGILQNACTLTYQLDLSAERIVATFLRAEQRLGGVSCASLLPAGTVVTANRMF